MASKSGLVLLASMTIATSALAGYKVTQTIRSQQSEARTDSQNSEMGGLAADNATESVTTSAGNDGKIKNTDQSSVTTTPNQNGVITDSQTTTTLQTAGATKTVNLARASNAPLPDQNICLVTISGIVYNVQPLRSPHPGGDIFVCDTDMTASYQRQHGTNFSQLTPYIYTGTTTTTPSIVRTAIVSDDTNSDGYDHEDEDKQDDRYEQEYDD